MAIFSGQAVAATENNADINMFIAVDIGNTHTVLGIYQNSRWIHEKRFADPPALDEAAVQKQVASFFSEHYVKPENISGAGISSVVPSLTKPYQNSICTLTNINPFIVSAEKESGIKILYEDKRSLGSDRLCTAVAGFAKYSGPIIIVDFGTATTYDVVTEHGEFLGGVIAPGIGTSIKILHEKTAQLPAIENAEITLPQSVIGTNTVAGMQSGILYGAIDAFEGMIKRISGEILPLARKNARIIITGGFAWFISQHSTLEMNVEPSLVLEGIRLIGERQYRTN
ncbi:MAG: type III pantothenate kinase [Bacteroidota bacterium]